VINGELLHRYWREIRASRQVRALWEQRFPELRHCLMDPFQEREYERQGLKVEVNRSTRTSFR
jgi:hypothetical protein